MCLRRVFYGMKAQGTTHGFKFLHTYFSSKNGLPSHHVCGTIPRKSSSLLKTVLSRILFRIIASVASCVALGLFSHSATAESMPAVRKSVDSFWSHMNIGQNAGKLGMDTIDTGNGREWVIAAGTRSYWYSLCYDSGKQTYRQIYAAPHLNKSYLPKSFSKIISAEVSDAHPGKEIVTLIDGIIHILDSTTKEEIRNFSTMTWENNTFIPIRDRQNPTIILNNDHSIPSDVFAADFDGDGRDELFLNSVGLKIFDAEGTLVWSMPAYESIEAVCQMDNDPSLEIITKYNVVDISTKSVQWAMSRYDYDTLATIDLNGDGNKEILYLDYWRGITAVDPVTNTILWNYSVPQGIGAMLITNFDETPEKELLLGNGQTGELYILTLNAASPVLKDTLIVPGRYIRNSGHTRLLSMADTDDDGTEELIWCTNDYSNTTNTFINLYDPIRKVFEWESPLATRDHGSPCTGDLTGDGIPELVVPTLTSHILIFDANTLQLIASPQIQLDNLHSIEIPTISLTDLDGDGICELCVSQQKRLGVFKYDTNSAEFTLLWRAKSPLQSRTHYDTTKGYVTHVENIYVGDVDCDNNLEVIATTGLAIDYLPDSIQIYDYNSGELEWVSGDILPQFRGYEAQSSGITSSTLADVDGNGHLDLLFTQGNGTLMVLDLVTKQIVVSNTGAYRSVAMMPDGKRFITGNFRSQLSIGTVSSPGYFRWATWKGYADPQGWLHIKSVVPDTYGGFYAFAGNQIYYIDSKGEPRWTSAHLAYSSLRLAMLETSSGTEVYAGWDFGISGFYTGQLNAQSTITVTTTGSAKENGPGDGDFIITASQDGVVANKVQFTLSGSATLGTDYTLQGTTQISPGIWEVSVDAASSASVNIVPLNDSAIEGPESIVLTLVPGVGYQIGTANSVSAPLVDDEPAVKIEVANSSAYEAVGTGMPRYMIFNVIRSGDLSKPLTVNLQLSGTARIKTDYTSSTTKSITIFAGMSLTYIQVLVAADAIAEATETVTYAIKTSGTYAIEPGKSSATGFIYDGQLSLSLGTPVTSPQGVQIPIMLSTPSQMALKVSLVGTLTPVSGGKAKKFKVNVTIPANATEGNYLLPAGKTASVATVALGVSTRYHLTAPQSITEVVPMK